mgnify:CR=1 FL=1
MSDKKSDINENPYEIECSYDYHKIWDSSIYIMLEFVDCEPVPIKDFGNIFKTVWNLPRIGEIVVDGSRWSADDLTHQYRVVDIKSCWSMYTYKIFYLKRLDTYKYKKEDENRKSIVQL